MPSSGMDNEEVVMDVYENPEDVDLVELESELWRAKLEKELGEMKALSARLTQGPHTWGWDSAIEEVEARMGLDTPSDTALEPVEAAEMEAEDA